MFDERNSNFSLDPSFGGTNCAFEEKIDRDWTVLQKYDGHLINRIIISHDRQRFYVEVGTDGQDNSMIKAGYNASGELTFATLWVLANWEGRRVNKSSLPDELFLEKISQLHEAGNDVLVMASVSNKILYFGRTRLLGSSGPHDQVIENQSPLPFGNIQLLSFSTKLGRVTEDGYQSYEFLAGVLDNTLILGFMLNHNAAVVEKISSFVNFDKLDAGSSPARLTETRNNIFVRI
jgi:hypothetical protein